MTQQWPWEDASLSELDMALKRMRVMFEFLDKLGLDYWAFHDRWSIDASPVIQLILTCMNIYCLFAFQPLRKASPQHVIMPSMILGAMHSAGTLRLHDSA